MKLVIEHKKKKVSDVPDGQTFRLLADSHYFYKISKSSPFINFSPHKSYCYFDGMIWQLDDDTEVLVLETRSE